MQSALIEMAHTATIVFAYDTPFLKIYTVVRTYTLFVCAYAMHTQNIDLCTYTYLYVRMYAMRVFVRPFPFGHLNTEVKHKLNELQQSAVFTQCTQKRYKSTYVHPFYAELSTDVHHSTTTDRVICSSRTVKCFKATQSFVSSRKVRIELQCWRR